jgi:hypothetical protein
MSLVRALRLVSGYISLPEAAKSELEQILAELETPAAALTVIPPEEVTAPVGPPPPVVDVAASSGVILPPAVDPLSTSPDY